MASSKYGVKDFLKSFINVPAWMGMNHLLRTANDISTLSRDLFTFKRPPLREETFEEAVARFNLSETDILQRQKAFGRLAAFYLFIAVCLGVYASYLFYKAAWLPVLMTLVLILVACSFAFKEHFWYAQMRQRRLGLTFKDWLLFAIGKSKVDKLTHE